MAKMHKFHHLPHSAADMRDLVASVERYKEFVPLISDLRVLSRTDISETQYEFEAEVVIAYKFFSETFRCRVAVNNQEQTVKVVNSGKSGAVKSLNNDWTFHELDDGSTLLEFVIDVTLKSKILNALVKTKFNAAVDYLVSRFEARAKAEYPVVKSAYTHETAKAALELS